jgi:hypothetical protein
MSLIHQLDLSSDRPRTTKWAAVMQETSCRVLQQSSANIARILRELVQGNYVRYLQDTMYATPLSRTLNVAHCSTNFFSYSIPFVLVPVAMSTVYLRSPSSTSAAIVHDLSTCYHGLTVFAERYEVVDYYMQLAEMCAAIANDRLHLDKAPYSIDCANMRKTMQLSLPGEIDETPLPPVETYLAALRALERCIVHGIADPVRYRCNK